MSTPDPQLLPQVGLSGKLPGALADLNSIAGDIGFAEQCASEYVALHASHPAAGPTTVGKALWFAAAIAYRRALNSGRGHLVAGGSRLKIRDAVPALLSTEQQLIHEEMLSMANKHIAHRVDDREGATVIALLSPDPAAPEVVAVGQMMVHMIGPPSGFAEQFLEICHVIRGALDADIERMQNHILEGLRGGSIDELYRAASTPGQSVRTADDPGVIPSDRANDS